MLQRELNSKKEPRYYEAKTSNRSIGQLHHTWWVKFIRTSPSTMSQPRNYYAKKNERKKTSPVSCRIDLVLLPSFDFDSRERREALSY